MALLTSEEKSRTLNAGKYLPILLISIVYSQSRTWKCSYISTSPRKETHPKLYFLRRPFWVINNP